VLASLLAQGLNINQMRFFGHKVSVHYYIKKAVSADKKVGLNRFYI
jgi:hypothetical protein